MDEISNIIGSESQENLVKMYSDYISRPKATFFKNIGLGVIQGKRNGIYIESLEGVNKGEAAIEWIDCRTSGGVYNLGHKHPEIIKAIKDGIEGGLDIGDHHLLSEQRALLARKMAGLLPGDINKTQFCVGGGEAIDLSIKLARGITKRKKIISAKLGYHGVTGFALGAGDERFKEKFLWNLPDFQQVEFDDIENFKNTIDENTAGVIFETIPATGGILIPSEGYFAQIRELCDDLGVIMIADEVQTGLGRTGHMWGIYGGLYENEKIIPDIIVLGKGMSAGYYPLSTCSFKPFIEELFEDDPFLHISSTGGSELGCYVSRKMLEIQSSQHFLDNVKHLSKNFGEKLTSFMNNTNFQNIINEVRGRGLMWGMEFLNESYGLRFTLSMIKNGIFADYCGNNEKVVKLMPPLIINEIDIEEIMNRLEKSPLGYN